MTLLRPVEETGYRIVKTDFTAGVMNLASLRNRALHVLAKAYPNLFFAYQFIVAAVRR